MAPADHPRSRGVYFTGSQWSKIDEGSSPLARGLPKDYADKTVYGRIIPARAGFTIRRQNKLTEAWDHPRSRGVYKPKTLSAFVAIGSSPLARGLRVVAVDPLRLPRIIPARAGFTTRWRPGHAKPGDHPRSRGVYYSHHVTLITHLGSSPLARGLLCQRLREKVTLRIIPARAGFTNRIRVPEGTDPDHPRSRGVYPAAWMRPRGALGSSPLARGLLEGGRPAPAQLRIIPARAGFTDSHSAEGLRLADHPRSRGVYCRPLHSRSAPAGSSPLARGLPVLNATGKPEPGIIPARAGFTAGRRKCRGTATDHPRSRGVYRDLFRRDHDPGGSSPLARGLPGEGHGHAVPIRIIPARAGFTRQRTEGAKTPADHPRSRGVYPEGMTSAGMDAGSSPLARGLPP